MTITYNLELTEEELDSLFCRLAILKEGLPQIPLNDTEKPILEKVQRLMEGR